ncbi:MAG TPA: energy transducer TonB [Flavobacteriales bacterium]|nr:energy transducer TonB [Flavobacteriales bacterium]
MKNLYVFFFLLTVNAGFTQVKTNEVKPEVIPDQAHVEEKAQFPGGQNALTKFIDSEIKYPAECFEKKIQGKVYVEFVIDENGKVKGARVKQKSNAALDAEALRVIKAMPRWKPAKVIGKPVRSMMVLPVSFKLPENDSEKKDKG